VRDLFLLILLPALLSCAGDSSEKRGAGAASDEPGGAVADAPTGCAQSFADRGVELHAVVTDHAGVEHCFREIPARIISLVPSATETLRRLGASGSLVGRTDYDTLAALSYLPSVGGGLHPNLEALLALEPELVIRFVGESDQVTPARLDELGIPHFAVNPESIRDVLAVVEMLGRIVGEEEEAEFMASEADEELGRIAYAVGSLPRVRVAYLLGGTPPWVAGPGTYIDELLTIAGGDNVFDDLRAPYAGVSPEELLAREIAVILAPAGVELELPPSHPPVVRVSPEIEIPGPWMTRSARELARALHPEADVR
jgi:iron complex transport system substrate-binding protein